MAFQQKLQDLEKSLSRMRTGEEKEAAFFSFIQDSAKSAQTSPMKALQPQPSAENPIAPGISEIPTEMLERFTSQHGLDLIRILRKSIQTPSSRVVGSTTPPHLGRLGCANHEVGTRRFCGKDSTKHCSACKLVGYCSKECQQEHWRLHKKDCKGSLRADGWQPSWIVDHREPMFVSNDFDHVSFGMGMILFGNIAAYDVLNLSRNEGFDNVRSKDLSLAFVGEFSLYLSSGDIRNLIRTVNELPNDYSGSLSVVFNDHNPIVVVRNLVMLLSLGSISDKSDAAEQALHLWYSLFLPSGYPVLVLAAIQEHIEQVMKGSTIGLTSTTTLKPIITRSTVKLLVQTLAKQMDASTAQNAWSKVMSAPERLDYRDRYYNGLRPSHRVAYERWRQFGILLPFSAPTPHMNHPNPWMFSEDNRLFFNDSSCPLQGWDVPTVLEAGAKYGTTKEDLMGCLFFFVKEQLVEFASRLQRFKITISLFDQDIRALSNNIAPTTFKFDRIEVSNVIDKSYVGMARVLADWGPFLNPSNDYAAIIGLLMNWITILGGSTHVSDIRSVTMRKYAERFPPPNPLVFRTSHHPWMCELLGSVDVLLENSGAFRRYLDQEGEAAASQRANLQMRSKNRIISHRHNVALGAPFSTLPELKDADAWYNATSLPSLHHGERYIEWELKKI
ncbi:hypothetical protein C8J56DRAFT_1168157 [Mycena floridula]|nr:hypothetical protein C8J56DRAFT_1168157 [Mycena floridula]